MGVFVLAVVASGAWAQTIKIRATAITPEKGSPASPFDDAESDHAKLSEGLVKRLDALVAKAFPATRDQDAFFDACLLESGSYAPLLAEIEKRLDSGSSTPTVRATLQAVLARAQWRRGDLSKASESWEKVVASTALRTHAEAWRAHAMVLEALDQVAEAMAAWGNYLALLPPDAERARSEVLLRLALLRRTEASAIQKVEARSPLRLLGLGLDGRPTIFVADPLLVHVSGLPPTLRNRAAVLLAMLGQPDLSLELYEATEEGSRRFRAEVRRTSWALDAKKPKVAERHAWAALRAAKLDRDRRYALALLVESYRDADGLRELVKELQSADDLPPLARKLEVDILRELGDVDAALDLFRRSGDEGLNDAMRGELLDMLREAGRIDELRRLYRGLIANDPRNLAWREGLSRFELESGDADAVDELWREPLETWEKPSQLMEAAEVLGRLGRDDLARALARKAAARPGGLAKGLLFLYELERNRGRLDEAEKILHEFDAAAAPDAPERIQLSEAFERIGDKVSAVRVLEALKAAEHGKPLAEDMEMRLAWLYSEVDREEDALQAWRTLWRAVKSVPRRAYVEDRMLNVASRLGVLADIAIEEEEKLADGEGDALDRGLLVRLYTKANDAVSAAEIISTYGRQSGDEVPALREMARVYLACADFMNYERCVRELMKKDPEGVPDYLRQLAMSALERARPDQARPFLRALKKLEIGPESSEFEAGVLALAGMYEDASRAYRKGLAAHPDRIEGSLLLADVLKKSKKTRLAVGMFQFLCDEAKKDDLFIIALDGLLNMRAGRPVLRWARRRILQRIAATPDKMYLYQMLSDVSEELNDRPNMLRAMKGALDVANERRSNVLRELMDLSARDRTKQLEFGRRLILLGDLVPPDVYLTLGDAFLAAGDVRMAERTFHRAVDVPDRNAFLRKVAKSFESAGYKEEALRVYEKVLVGESWNVELISRVAKLDELLGRDEAALALAERALDLMLARRPFSSVKSVSDSVSGPRFFWGGRNLQDYDRFFDSTVTSFLVLAGHGAKVDDFLDRLEAKIDEERAAAQTHRPDRPEDFALGRYPRLSAEASLVRRVAMATGRIDRADALDRILLTTFPRDAELLGRLVSARLSEGFVASARNLVEESGRSDEEKVRARFLAGTASAELPSGTLSAAAARPLFLPLYHRGALDQARRILYRIALPAITKDDLISMPELLSVSVLLGESDAALRFARRWVDAATKFKRNWELSEEVRKCLRAAWSTLDVKQRLSLARHLSSKLVAEPKKLRSLIDVVIRLQKQLPEPLLEADEIKSLMDSAAVLGSYDALQLLDIVPEGDRKKLLEEAYAKAPTSNRVYFLINVVSRGTSNGRRLDAVTRQFVLGRFQGAVDELGRGLSYFYVDNIVALSDREPELAAEVLRILREEGPDNLDYALAQAGLELQAGKTDDALEGLRKLVTRIAEGETFGGNERRLLLAVAGLYEKVDESLLLGVLDDHDTKAGPSERTALMRVSLASQGFFSRRALRLARKAAEKFPESREIQSAFLSTLRQSGRDVEVARVADRLARRWPDDKGRLRAAESAWRGLKNPEAIRRLKKDLGTRTSEKKKTSAPGKGKLPRATVKNVKAALDAGRIEEARRLWRRVWRRLDNGGGDHRFIFLLGGGVSTLTWPTDEKAKADVGRNRGPALPDLGPSKPKRAVRDAFDAIAETPFGEDELGRQVRSLRPSQAVASTKLLAGYLKARMIDEGREGFLSGLSHLLRRGLGGAVDYAELLLLLEKNPDIGGDGTLSYLDELLSVTRPTDGARLRRIARLFGRLGAKEASLRLYRWCFPLIVGSRFSWWSPPPPAEETIDELTEVFEEPLLSRAVDAYLGALTPDVLYGSEDEYEKSIIEAHRRIAGLKEAFRRTRKMCLYAADPEVRDRRGAAMAALAVLASVGKSEEALAVWKKVACRATGPRIQRWRRERSPSFAAAQYRTLFPPVADGGEALGRWYRRAFDATAEWMDEKRIDPREGVQHMAVLLYRLHEAGQGTAKDLEALIARAGQDRTAILWCADLADRMGQAETSLALRERLFAEGRLPLGRVLDLVRDLERARGIEAAYETARKAAEWTCDPKLLDRLEAMAGALGKAEDVKRWKALKARAWPSAQGDR